MDKIALTISLVSLAISLLNITIAKNKEITKSFEPTKKVGAVLFKPKTPEQVRLEKKLNKKQDFNIEDLW